MSRQSRRYRFVVGCFIQFCKSDHGAIPVEGPAQIGNVQGSRRCAALNAHCCGHADCLTIGEALRGHARGGHGLMLADRQRPATKSTSWLASRGASIRFATR